jgi:tripartite-type tricarboxylate transporter receptor subunit TctC
MRALIVGTALVLVLASGGSIAQSWPASPVTIYIANSAGSSPDILLRQVTERLSRSMRQQFVIINRAGANGIPATMAVAKAQPDGYTLLFSGNSQMTANVFLVKDLPYDPDRDFTPIAMVVDSAPFIIAAHPSLPANTMPELIALARAQPGKLSYGAAGALSPIVGEMLNRAAGMNIVQVPYKDTAQSMNETVAGMTQLNYQALPTVEPLVRAGKLKYIAVTSLKRFHVIPDVPAVSETIPGFSIDGWFVMLGPAGMPAERVRILNREIDSALKDPDLNRRMATFGFASSGAGTPDSVREHLRAGREQWQRIVKELGLPAQ